MKLTTKTTTKNGTICYNHFENVTIEEVKKAWLGKLVNFSGAWFEVVSIEAV